MDLTAQQIKHYLSQILMVLGPVSKYTETKLDDKAVELLEAVYASDELIELVVKWFAGSNPEGLDADIKALLPIIDEMAQKEGYNV